MCRGLHWDGTGHEQNQKAIPVPRGRGRGQRGELRPFPTSVGSPRAGMLQGPWRAPSQAHSSCFSANYCSQEMKEELPWFSLSDGAFHSKSDWAASRELHLETHKTFASVLLITGAAHSTLNINGLQLLFKWYGNCYFILKCPLSNKAKD